MSDLYAQVTDKIIAALETGTRPWHMPWASGHVAGSVNRPLRSIGKPYQGINVLMLWATAMERGYSAPIWMTYKQAQELGGNVRKGERGTLVVYANAVVRTETNDKGEDTERAIPFLKGYSVFNVEQIDGLPPMFTAAHAPRLNEDTRNAQADTFFTRLGADIRHGGNSAHYTPSLDTVQIPAFEAFESAAAYYATLAHEITHWTRHPSRLDRDLGRKRFGDAGYALEELVAEIGASFLCADLQLEPRIDDSAAYIASWIKVLQNDKRAIFTAASAAQKAADYLHSLQSVESEALAIAA